jgi:hypothetical protein
MSIRPGRALTASVLLAAVLGPAAQSPAVAAPVVAPMAAAVVATAFYQPGLPCPRDSTCDLQWGFTLVLAGVTAPSTASCLLFGVARTPRSLPPLPVDIEGLVEETGNGTFSCSDGTAGGLAYSRVGPALTISGSATVRGSCFNVTGAGAWGPASAQPTQMAEIVAALALIGC